MDGWVRDCGGNVGKLLAGWTIDDGRLTIESACPSSVVCGLSSILNRLLRVP
jgi:hypothetical protein